MTSAVTFLKEVRAELAKVTWPSKQKTIQYSLAVIAISIAVAIFLGVLDYFFSDLVQQFLIK